MEQDLNDLVKVDQYRRCILLLQKRCESIQKENERFVHRLYMTKKITKRRNREVAMLKSRLDLLYNDGWRIEPWPKAEREETSTRNGSKNTQNGKKTKGSAAGKDGKKPGTKKKRVKPEKEKDPNAPKRPANPFFQFCQEQRSVIMDELNSELPGMDNKATKQELTKQLAFRWKTLDSSDKQIYINMYENSKQKYNLEMMSYKRDVDKNEKDKN